MMHLQAKEGQAPSETRKTECEFSLSDSRKRVTFLITCFQTSSLQDYKEKIFCCFKSARLWEFVTAEPENQNKNIFMCLLAIWALFFNEVPI